MKKILSAFLLFLFYSGFVNGQVIQYGYRIGVNPNFNNFNSYNNYYTNNFVTQCVPYYGRMPVSQRPFYSNQWNGIVTPSGYRPFFNPYFQMATQGIYGY